MRDLITKINYFYLILILLWLPFQETVKLDGLGRIPVFTSIFVFGLNFWLDKNFKRLTFSKPILFWGIWVIYSIINLQQKGYIGEIPLFYYFGLKLFMPFVTMVVTTKETIENPLKLIKYLLYILLLYCLFSITLLGANIGLSESGERSTGELGNLGPLTAIYIIFFSSLLFVYRKISVIKLVFMSLFGLLIVIGAVTRKAFGAALIMIFMLLLSQLKLKPGQIFLVLILGCGLYYGSVYTLENTALGERFEQGIEVGAVKNTTDIGALSLLGDRAFFYINAWDVFTKNPLTGIGLGNFRYVTDTRLLIHSEYMVQLAEGGILGTFFFITFNLWIGIKLFEGRFNSEYKKITIILSGGFLSILFINFTAWTFSFPHYFVVFGLIIGYIRLSKYNLSTNQLVQ